MRAQTKLNGVNVDQLMEIINHIKEQPELANFLHSVQLININGGHSCTKIIPFTVQANRTLPVTNLLCYKVMNHQSY